MDRILVISFEPSLAETLGSEMPDVTFSSVAPERIQPALEEEGIRLLLADGAEAAASAAHSAIPLIRLDRPVRLSDLVYTIQSRLQGKTAALREEIAMAPGFRLLMAERSLRSEDGSVAIALTEKEGGLLAALATEPGKTLPREALLKRVWGYSDDIATRTLETHIYRLRGKLRQAGEHFDIVFSEEGGYRLVV